MISPIPILILKPWQKKMWCIPKVDVEFVARMEDVLDLYADVPDKQFPVVCFDETPRQLTGEARVPVTRAAGTLRKRSSLGYAKAARVHTSATSSAVPATTMKSNSVMTPPP